MEKIYFAAGLFSQAEKEFNLKICSILESFGYSVFLPQRDGFEAKLLNGLTQSQVVDKIFEKDTTEIKLADIFFMVLDGRVPDDGACVELGIAYALGKKIYGIKTDTRSLEINLDLNPLIEGCFTKIFRDTNISAIENLKNFLKENKF